MRAILIFVVLFISTDVFGQESFIETEFSRRAFAFSRLHHSIDNNRLDDSGLQKVFENNSTSLNYLETGKRYKGIGSPLVLIGTAGILGSLFIDDGSFLLYSSSLVVSAIGFTFINSHIRNQMRAVNNYNRDLYEEMAMEDAEPLIQMEYLQDPFRVVSYYQDGKLLRNRDLTALLGNEEPFEGLLKKANTQRGIGIALASVGTVGLFGGSFNLFDDSRNRNIVAIGSLATLISGAIVINISRANRQSAVNLYNKQLFESATGTASLNLNVNPTGGGLVLSF